MKVLVTGVCGFVGSALATCLIERVEGLCVVGMDNMIRPGSETNRLLLEKMGIKLIHADLRSASDLEELPDCDWVIDAAANQGCSMLSTEAPVGQGIEPSEGGGVSILTEGAGSVTA